MKITATGGTDGANIVLFWPDHLPEDGDRQLNDDPVALVEKLSADGKLVWFPCEGDGAYSVAIYLHDDLPQDLKPLCKEVEQISGLSARGNGYFGGMEYMFKTDSSFLQKYPHMCQPVAIPEGTYSAIVFRTDIPDGVYQSWLVSQAGAKANRLWAIHKTIAALAVAGVFAALVSFFFVKWTVWFGIAAAAAGLVIAAVAMSRTQSYRRVRAAVDDFEKAFPSYVVLLR